jgi:hypothetical protein
MALTADAGRHIAVIVTRDMRVRREAYARRI